MNTINIIIPVLNEENRLENGINKAMKFLKQENIPCIVTIIDNGSTDNTAKMANNFCKQYNNLEYLRLEQKGVGLAFREGIIHNSRRENPCKFIGYMDIDLSTDLNHLKQVYSALCNGDKIIIGSRLLKDSKVIGRSFKRSVISKTLNFILKIILKVKFSDAMCGFKFYNAKTAEYLVSQCNQDNSWFYCAQMLIVAEYNHIDINEIAVIWEDESNNSKVKIFKLARIYLNEIFKLWVRKVTNKINIDK